MIDGVSGDQLGDQQPLHALYPMVQAQSTPGTARDLHLMMSFLPRVAPLPARWRALCGPTWSFRWSGAVVRGDVSWTGLSCITRSALVVARNGVAETVVLRNSAPGSGWAGEAGSPPNMCREGKIALGMDVLGMDERLKVDTNKAS